jgi:hypothetical protein
MDAKLALRDLIVAAAVEGGGEISSLGHCRDACQTLWGLDVEIDELRSAVRVLADDGVLHPRNGGYVLADGVHAEIGLTLETSEKVEQQAVDEWERALRSLQPSLTDEELSLLRDDLQLWLRQVILRHGIEAALVLYPENTRGQEMMGELERMGFDFLPARPKKIEILREQAFFTFIRQPTETQRLFLANLMNTAYFLAVLSLDPEAKELVRDVARGQRVYLDTNVVYRLLNLQTPRAFLSTQRLLSLTKDLGYTLAVTPWTITELRFSLERARAYLKSKPIPPGELAALAASATTDENFITAYWRRIRSKPVSIDDFFDFYNEIEEHISQHGVEVIADGCIAVERDQAAIDEQLGIIDSIPGPRFKPDPVKEHDIKHRLLIERLRGESSRRFANAGFWFLTADSSLPRYDYVARGGGPTLPFCVTTGAWLQVTRSFVPRTEDYDQTLTDLLASPYVRYRGRISYDTVQEVVSRIDLFSGATPDLAAKLLYNTALLREVADTPDEDARHELIENAVVAAAESLERQVEEAERRIEQERADRKLEEGRAQSLEQELQRTHAELSRLANRLVAEEQARAEAEDQRNADVTIERLQKDQAIRELQEQSASFTAFRGTLVRVLRFAGAALLFVLAAAGSSVSIGMGIVEGELAISLVIAGAFALTITAIAVAVNRRMAWQIAGAVALFLGVVAAIYEIQK